jgi:hypothetical protein
LKDSVYKKTHRDISRIAFCEAVWKFGIA